MFQCQLAGSWGHPSQYEGPPAKEAVSWPSPPIFSTYAQSAMTPAASPSVTGKLNHTCGVPRLPQRESALKVGTRTRVSSLELSAYAFRAGRKQYPNPRIVSSMRA